VTEGEESRGVKGGRSAACGLLEGRGRRTDRACVRRGWAAQKRRARQAWCGGRGGARENFGTGGAAPRPFRSGGDGEEAGKLMT
jgi:hypothetical protein